MNLFLRGAACASLLALVAGCCANSTNTCDDLYADSLYFKFDTSSFNKAELDTVYLQRYTPARPAMPANGATPAIPAAPAAYSDPISIIRAKQNINLNSGLLAHLKKIGIATTDTVLVISNNSPFPPSTTGGKLSNYRYLLTVQNKPVRPLQTYQFDLDSIQLKGKYDADGCTTCYQNTLKYFKINGGKITRNATEIYIDNQPVNTQDGKPIVTVLSKNEAIIK